MVKRVVEQAEVIGRRLFGQLDDHAARRYAVALQQLQGAPRRVRCFQQRLRRDVEKQLALQLLFAEAATGRLATGKFELTEASGLAGDSEQVERGMQRAVGRTASQGFVAE